MADLQRLRSEDLGEYVARLETIDRTRLSAEEGEAVRGLLDVCREALGRHEADPPALEMVKGLLPRLSGAERQELRRLLGGA